MWTPQDYQKIRHISGCTDVMIGRGAIIRPDLMRRIKTLNTHNTQDAAMPWPELQHWVIDYYEQLLARMDAR
ncbi:MAG: tRNA-dihydrouridine synthase, partial [Gallionella sp.]|nr:tRNA-dihydrouridine synthase [Gallionella sp.]